MIKVARSGVCCRLPGQMNIRTLNLNFSHNFPQTATKNAGALATRNDISRPPPKSTEEELKLDYEQLLQQKKPESKMDQFAKWVNFTTGGAAVIFGYIGYIIFQKTGLQELTAYVGLLGLVVTAAKYVVDSFSETIFVQKQLLVGLAKVHSNLRTEISSLRTEVFEAMEQQTTEISSLRTDISSLRTELLEAFKASKP